jgi:hypothetical protein
LRRRCAGQQTISLPEDALSPDMGETSYLNLIFRLRPLAKRAANFDHPPAWMRTRPGGCSLHAFNLTRADSDEWSLCRHCKVAGIA